MTDHVRIHGSQEGGKCGYCKNRSQNNKVTFGLSCKRMTPLLYCKMNNRGFRRCGTYIYKPENSRQCCPMYPIRCNALEFRPSRSHKRTLRIMNEFLQRDIRPRNSAKAGRAAGERMGETPTKKHCVTAAGDAAPSSSQETCARGDDATYNRIVSSPPSDKRAETPKSAAKPEKARAKRWIAKQRRIAEIAERSGVPLEQLIKAHKERREARIAKSQPKSLEDLIRPHLSGASSSAAAAHTLELRVLHERSAEARKSREAEHAVYERYQMSVHGDSRSKVNMTQFTRFLIDSPLTVVESGRYADLEFGSFRFQYWLDGSKLIAVEVVDVMPEGASSVYLFYDPDFEFLELGKYSALRMFHWIKCKAANQLSPPSPSSSTSSSLSALETKKKIKGDHDADEFCFYFMGFFIYSCQKMRYKAQYRGSEIACPVTHRWVSVLRLFPLFERGIKYARFASNSASSSSSSNSQMKQSDGDDKEKDSEKYPRLKTKRGDLDFCDVNPHPELIKFRDMIGPVIARLLIIDFL